MATARSTNVRSSRFVQGGTTDQFPDRLGWWDRTNFPTAVTDVPITLSAKYDKRPDLLAYDAFGKAQYQGLILQYNNIVDINTEFVKDAVILVPLPSRFVQDFLNKTPDMTTK